MGSCQIRFCWSLRQDFGGEVGDKAKSRVSGAVKEIGMATERSGSKKDCFGEYVKDEKVGKRVDYMTKAPQY